MADIALRTYYKQIDQLIDQKHLEEALAYCKNILHHFPKDLEAYRLMGKTLLERGRHGDAADVFQRVLSAQPDDFISHVGMAIVREDEGNLEAALWHMERAFESSPSNPAVQDELRRLYGRRDGIVPHRAQLTRGALARLYFKQGLYAQAETELRAGLTEQPDRPDLITLLVQVLWENGHRGEAGALCSDLLQRLPHNLEANRVMAQIATAENRADDARACRARLEALDPYEAFATAGMSATSVNADAVRITEIAYSPELSTPSQPDWSNALGADLQGQTEDVLPDWVKSGTSLLVGDGPTDPSKVNTTPDLPDWMRATTGILTGALTSAPAESTPEATDLNVEPAEPAEEPPAAPSTDFLPDWLSEAAAPTTVANAASDADWLNALSTTEPAPSNPTASEALPDWLRGAADEASVDTPDWMRQSPSAPTSSAGDGLSAPETKSPETPEWMSLAADAAETDTPEQTDAPLTAAALGSAGAGALLGEPEPDVRPATGDNLPDWLTSAAGQDAGEVPDWLSGVSAKADDPTAAPDWMRTDAPAPADDSVFATDAPDWLRGATGQTGMLGGAAPSEPTPAPEPKPFVEDDDVEASADVPAWLAAARPVEEPAALDETVPDWLSAAATDTGALGDLPDWLKVSEPAVTDVTLPAATVEEPPIPEATVDVRAVEPTPSANATDIELPDWLNAAAEAPTSTNEGTEAGAFDADAFAWLEGLAARQGADPETLSTPAPETGDDVPDWLTSASEATQTEQPTSASAATPETLSNDDAFAWLEGLAARQGADPETLSATPSEVELPDFLQPASPEAIERANTPIDWSDTGDEPIAAVDTPEADADEGAMPDWIKALAPSTDAATAQPLETLPDVDPDELPDWLRPADTAAPLAAAPAETGAAADDAAFAWLESLAAAQGADPATLSTPETTQSPEPGDLPDWLTVAPEAATSMPAEVDETPAAPLAAAPAETGAADDDAAFAWLESLAAAQGADPETLSTPAPTTPTASIDLPDWLTSEPEAPTQTPAEASSVTAPAPAEPADDDAAFAWLESLAAAQGADPATLTTPPAAAQAPSESEIALPDWLSGDVSMPATDSVASEAVEPPADRKATRPLPPIETEDVDLQGVAWLRTPIENVAPAADPAEITLPDWLQSEIAPQTSILTPPPAARAEEPPAPETPAQPEAPAGPPITTSDKRTALLAGKLADRKRAREAEIEDKFERQRAAREAAQREIENKLASRRAGVAPEPSELPTAPLPTLDATPAAPEPVAQAPRPSTGPLDLGRPRWRPRGTPAFVDVAPEDLLARSREQLAGGQEAVAMTGYTHLIKTGHQVESILAELQSHIGRGKAGAVAYRALGDAQMKVGRLQDALASYRAALERA